MAIDTGNIAPLTPRLTSDHPLEAERDSTNTNYDLSQPRRFSQYCRRYGRRGISLRNVTVPGKSRKSTKANDWYGQMSDVVKGSGSGSKGEELSRYPRKIFCLARCQTGYRSPQTKLENGVKRNDTEIIPSEKEKFATRDKLDCIVDIKDDNHKSLLEHEKSTQQSNPLVSSGNEDHITEIQKKNQNVQWNMGLAAIFTAVAAQNLSSLFGGSGPMHTPRPILYLVVATNAIAFLSSSLALLLFQKKPYVARIFEVVGFGSGITTFLLMMTAFLPGPIL